MGFRSNSIGFFDSGVGGISVLKKALNILDNETFIYFGDSKNSPYGSKSKNEIIRLCTNICNFLIYENNCKAIVVACNTASSAAITVLREKYEPIVPIIGIEPAIKPAVDFINLNNKLGFILVLATPFTVKGEKLKNLMSRYKNYNIECISLDKLAYMIEEQYTNQEIYNYLYTCLENYIGRVSCVVLGCTHYYFVQDIIKEILGGNLEIFDGSLGTVRELKRRLIDNKIFNYKIKEDKRIYIYNSLSNKKVLDSYRMLEWGGSLK